VCGAATENAHRSSSVCTLGTVSGGAMSDARRDIALNQFSNFKIQEAFEICWAHLPLRAAARRLF